MTAPSSPSVQAMAAAFTTWWERYQADPDAFAGEWPEASSYGEAAARYLWRLLDEQVPTQRVPVWMVDDPQVLEQLVLTRVQEDEGSTWIAEDAKRPGCFAGGESPASALAMLPALRATWDEHS